MDDMANRNKQPFRLSSVYDYLNNTNNDNNDTANNPPHPFVHPGFTRHQIISSANHYQNCNSIACSWESFFVVDASLIKQYNIYTKSESLFQRCVSKWCGDVVACTVSCFLWLG